jgi:hypothetical protein
MKFNITTGLIAFFSIWAIVLFILVYKSTQENIDLVTKDYYNREIAYQGQIDKEKNASGLSQPLRVVFNKSGNAVEFVFPGDFRSKPITGSIHFFRPDDATKDFDVKLEGDTMLTYYFPAEQMKKGLWRAQVEWQCNEVSYFAEESILVN